MRIEITEDGERRSIYSRVSSGGSFGANPLRREIGLGGARKIDLLEIYWPVSDQTQQFRNVAADQWIEITEGQDGFRELEHGVTELLTRDRDFARFPGLAIRDPFLGESP